MGRTRERVINTVFLNRGAIANAATAMRDDRARARDRAEVERAVSAAQAGSQDRDLRNAR